ncbi:MAG: hypothetical protein Q7J38_10090 [Gallionella sp.]|nr:hypothetical protein [Gallionella sp.]
MNLLFNTIRLVRLLKRDAKMTNQVRLQEEFNYKPLENPQLLRDNPVFECGYLERNAEWAEHSAEPIRQFINLRCVALLYYMSCEDY